MGDGGAWALAQLEQMTNARDKYKSEAHLLTEERDRLYSLLGQVHPPHPQPEICEACIVLGRPNKCEPSIGYHSMPHIGCILR